MPAAFGRLLGTATENELSGSQTAVVTTSATHNAGESIRVGVAVSAGDITGVVDSAGNTYVQETDIASTRRIKVYVSNGANGLASGGTITVTTSHLGTRTVEVVTCCDTGSRDASNESTGSGSGTSSSSGTPGAATNGGIKYGWSLAATNVGGTEASGWTTVSELLNVSPAMQFRVGYRLTDGTAHDYNPTISGGSIAYVAAQTDFGDPSPSRDRLAWTGAT